MLIIIIKKEEDRRDGVVLFNDDDDDDDDDTQIEKCLFTLKSQIRIEKSDSRGKVRFTLESLQS